MDQLSLFQQPDEALKPEPDSPLAQPSVREILERFPGLYLGTSSWTFPGWEKLVYAGAYSKELLAKKGLKPYSELGFFRTVSLDRTYYRPMSEAEYTRLANQVSPEFKFIVKAPRELLKVSHGGFELSAFMSRFLTPLVNGLGSNLGVVLLQFPPGTANEVGPSFHSHLGRFLNELPTELAFSLEIRDDLLLTSQLSAALSGTPASLCGSIHSSLPDPDQQLLRVPPTPEIPLVFRWNIRPSMNYEEARGRFEPFSQIQLEDRKRRNLLARLVKRALSAGRSVYVTANNKAEGCAPMTLLRFLEELSSIYT